MVEQWNSRTCDGGTVEHLMVEQWTNHGGTSDGGTVEHLMVEQCNGDGGTVEQRLWNSGTDIMEQ